MSHVGRKESMRWATSEQSYDGGDWEENELEEIAEEDETMSIKSEDLQVKHDDDNEKDYRDIYNYYDNDDDEDSKRQSLNQQLEDDIYKHLDPGHSRSTSKDSHVDPELAVLYQGTDEFLNRPISIYSDSMQTKPLILHASDSDRYIHKILTPANSNTVAESVEDTSDLATPVAGLNLGSSELKKELKGIEEELSEPQTAPPPAPVSNMNKPLPKMPPATPKPESETTSQTDVEASKSSIPRPPCTPPTNMIDTFQTESTPNRSPSLESVVFSPVELPTRLGYDISSGSTSSVGSRKSFVASPDKSISAGVGVAPALALTAATPEGSDTEQDARERPDWQPRWTPNAPRPDQQGTDLHESQISLDPSPQTSASKPNPVQGFVDSPIEGQGDSSDDDADMSRSIADMPSLNSTVSKDESMRSTIGSLDNDPDIPEIPEMPSQPVTAKDTEPKGIAEKITRPPHVDLQAVFAFKTSEKRQQGLCELRIKESEYTTQLNTWLETTLKDIDDRSLLFTDGRPPESEGHALPASRQVGTAISHSGVKTKETFQKVGKGLNAMKKLMRS